MKDIAQEAIDAENLEARLVTVAERQRRSDAEQHEYCVSPSAWPLVTDAPSKPALRSQSALGPYGPIGVVIGAPDVIAREIASWDDPEFRPFRCAECGTKTREELIPWCIGCGETYVPARLDRLSPERREAPAPLPHPAREGELESSAGASPTEPLEDRHDKRHGQEMA